MTTGPVTGTFTGWGRSSRVSTSVYRPTATGEVALALAAAGDDPVLAVGAGRSYGDAGLNGGGVSVLTTGLDRVLSFDPGSGEIVCEPGVSFRHLHEAYLDRGFAVPVTPGTGFATIGGAVANDVHGKNHDRCGSFGDHVLWIELLRPDGDVIRISRERSPEVFAATVGGIGLTGLMLAVCFVMVPVPSNAVDLREQRIPDLTTFFERFEEVRGTAAYSIGWVDGLARGPRLGRGILETAEDAPEGVPAGRATRLRMPVDAPGVMLNSWSVGLFNALYYRRVAPAGRRRRVPREKFLYPLDAIGDWNRLYGRRGFYQFQCVIPDAESRRGIRRLLEEISRARAASFLAVLKTLGGEGRGFLSFCRRGYTLALDFPRRPGAADLMRRLERITLDHEGRVYLAKDACLSAEGFERMYPKLDRYRAVLRQIDPRGRMGSDMSRRLRIRGETGRSM